MPWASRAGARIFYEAVGSGDPLLLIAGQASDRRAWDGVVADFADTFRVITFDHLGTGDSDAPVDTERYATRAFAHDAVAVLDAAGIDRAHAYGISMGGRVCQWLGADHGRRVRSLVLGCTSPGNAHGVPRDDAVYGAMITSSADPARAVAFRVEHDVSPSYVAAHPEYLARVRAEIARRPPPLVRTRHFFASEGHDAWDHLPAIRVPTLVIHGTDDLLNPAANAALLAGRIPDAELHMVQGGRHAYYIEFRDESRRVVTEFLGRAAARG